MIDTGQIKLIPKLHFANWRCQTQGTVAPSSNLTAYAIHLAPFLPLALIQCPYCRGLHIAGQRFDCSGALQVLRRGGPAAAQELCKHGLQQAFPGLPHLPGIDTILEGLLNLHRNPACFSQFSSNHQCHFHQHTHANDLSQSLRQIRWVLVKSKIRMSSNLTSGTAGKAERLLLRGVFRSPQVPPPVEKRRPVRPMAHHGRQASPSGRFLAN